MDKIFKFILQLHLWKQAFGKIKRYSGFEVKCEDN